MRKDTEMAQGKLMLNNEWNTIFQSLPNDKAGELIKALYSCHNKEMVDMDDPVLFSVFAMMSETVCENAEKYEEKCRKNAENRSKKTEKETERPSTTVNDRSQNKNIKEKDSKESKEKDVLTDIQKESPAKSEPLLVAAQEIIKYLNEKAGTHYRTSSKETVAMIKARMNDHYTVDDFEKVIDVKVAEWKGTDQERYLRPETLFRPSHFESYLNQPMPKARTGTKKVTKFDQGMVTNYDNRELARMIVNGV